MLDYTAGVSAAADGSTKVNAGAKQLKDGAAELKSGAAQLVPGIEKLSDGSKQLADGIKQLNDKGISKLTGLAGDDLQNLVDRVKAAVNVSKIINPSPELQTVQTAASSSSTKPMR